MKLVLDQTSLVHEEYFGVDVEASKEKLKLNSTKRVSVVAAVNL